MNASVISEMRRYLFVERGTAMFRVWGDGVLQVVKFEGAPGGVKRLKIGLFSLYSELIPQWFTSQGCIPRYHISNVIGQRGSYFPIPANMRARHIAAQEEILLTSGIPWLNEIDTQKKLIDGLVFLETSDTGSIHYVDALKIAPYLAFRDYDSAEHVIASILEQHRISSKLKRQSFSTHEAYMEYVTCMEKEDMPLVHLLNMIQKRELSEIDEYLQQNYSRNCQYAKFCMRKRVD